MFSGFPALESPINETFSSKLKRSCGGTKHASMLSIMGLGELMQAECLIHDSNIENKHTIFFRPAEQVFKDCNDLGISHFVKWKRTSCLRWFTF